MSLSEIGVCEYNGYRFNATTKTTHIRVTPEEDSSGRVTKYSQWEIGLQTYISDPSDVSSVVKDAVAKLQTHGAPFIFRGRGLGNPDINTSQMKDVKWGPRPGQVTLENHGKRGMKLNWMVTFCIPKCPNGQFEFSYMEFNYTVSHEIDKHGFVRRVIQGHLEIPMTRKSVKDQTLPNSVDMYRDKIEPPLMERFRRTYAPWVVSEDRRRLDFSFIDQEMPGDPLPEGVVEATLSEATNSSSLGLQKWEHSIEATYEMAAGVSPYNGVAAFFAFVENRKIEWLTELKKKPNDNQSNKTENLGSVFPTRFGVVNPNHYGPPTVRLSMGFAITCSLVNMLTAVNHFKPVANSSWKMWQASIRNTAMNPYGSLRLVFSPSAERFGDLCSPLQPQLLPNTLLPKTNLPNSQMANIEARLMQIFKPPEESVSWISYDNAFYLETDDGASVMATIPDELLRGKQDIFGREDGLAGVSWDASSKEPLPSFPGAANNRVGVLSNNQSPDAVRRTLPQVVIYLRGSAVRANFPIDPPRLLSVNGVQAVPANRHDRGEGFARDVRSNFGFPVHRAGWNLRFVLEGMPKGALPAPPNPMLGVS